MIHVVNAALSVLVLIAPAGPPGLYFEQTTVVRREGVAAGPGVRSRVWHAGRRLRLEAGDAPGGPALVLRLDEGRVLRLDPEARVAVELDAARLRARAHQDASVAATLMGADDVLRRSAIEGRRTIAGHACRGFRLRGRDTAVDVWVAEDLPAGAGLFADFLEWSGAAQSLGPLLAAIRDLPGFPLETRTRVSVLGDTQETVSTVTAVLVGPQPAGLFEVPAGFRLEREAP